MKTINKLIKKEQLDGLIPGCTELPMILKEGDVGVPPLNTTETHVDKMVEDVFSY